MPSPTTHAPHILIPPPCEPLSLTDAKLQLRVDSTFTADDAIIASCISAARTHIEDALRRNLVLTTLRLMLDGFPLGGCATLATLRADAAAIELFGGPVLSASIHYRDTDGTWQLLAADQFQMESGDDPARLMPAGDNDFGGSWPDTAGGTDAVGSVRVDYVCGYMIPFTASTGDSTISRANGAGGFGNEGILADGVYPNDDGGFRVLSIGGSLPTGLTAFTNYFLVNSGGHKLATTAGGATVTLTSTGSGTLLIDRLPDSLRHALRILTEFFYENRGDVTAEIPMAVGHLLNPEKVWRF